MLSFPLFPQEASSIAGQVDTLMLVVFLISILFSVLIAGLIVFFSIRYHHAAKTDRTISMEHTWIIEILWTLIPLGIVLILFGWGAKIYIEMSEPPANAITMYVVGKQWMWKMQHPEGRREINELHIPVGYPVKLLMTSEDVIHSFYVPAFRVKQDVLPGRYSMVWFEATTPGEYHLFCAQYCGTSHSGMIGKVIAMPPADYERWLMGGTAVMSGETLFNQFQCATCHLADGRGRGPALQGLFGHHIALENGKEILFDENYVRESILKPNAKIVQGYKAVMPTYQGQLQEEDIVALISYIKSLKEVSHD